MTRAGKHWSYSEYRRVKKMQRNGISLKDIAKQMGRSVPAIKAKLELESGENKRAVFKWMHLP